MKTHEDFSIKTQAPNFTSPKRNADLAEAMPHLVWTTDKFGAVDFINQNCLNYTGYDASISHKGTSKLEHWLEALHPDDAVESYKKWQTAVSTESVFHHEYRLRRHDGVHHWFLARAVPMLDKNGDLTHWVGTATDIHDFRRAMSALQESRNQFEVILQGMSDGVTAFDGHGQFVYANHVGAKLCGFDSVEEMLATPTSKIMDRYILLDENNNPFPLEKLPGRQALAGIRNPTEAIVQVKSKDSDQIRWSIINAAPIYNDSGELIYSVSIFRDFTHHKQNEQNLKNREAFLQLLADSGVILNSSLDYLSTLQKLVERIIPQMADWCMVDLVCPTEKTHSIVWHQDPTRREHFHDYRKRYPINWEIKYGAPNVIRTGRSELYGEISTDLMIMTAQSHEHYEEGLQNNMRSAMIVPIPGLQRIHGAITFVTSESGRKFTVLDLTAAEDIGRRVGQAIDKSMLYESERLARKNAETASKTKSTFLANMSHEIRTPLNALIGFNELLRGDNLTTKERSDYHHIIQRNGEMLLHIIDDILDLSKVEAGHLVLESIKISLPQLLDEVATYKSAKAQSKNLKFTIHLDDDVPKELITDPIRLKQILNNILGNAIKFTTNGSIELSVKLNRENNRIIFAVTDSGIGIPLSMQNKLFQAFIQADASVTRRYGGTGLGLILSKRLAQNLGGDLYLKNSVEGQGTTFVFEIAPALTPVSTMAQTKLAPEKQLQGRRILVVDDSVDNLVLIEHVLRKRGAIIESAENGLIGVEKALAGAFDIVLMDVQMPVLDGHSATRQLREKNYAGPIIALTAHAMHDDRVKCLEAGATDFLTKPLRTDILLQTLSRYL